MKQFSDLDLFKEVLYSKLEYFKSLCNTTDDWDLGYKACCEKIQEILDVH